MIKSLVLPRLFSICVCSFVECLLWRGADPNLCNGDGLTPLHLAVDHHFVSMVHILVSFGANANFPSFSHVYCLLNATSKGFSDVVRFLVSSGANVNDCNARRWTALHFAVAAESMELSVFLLSHGANPNFLSNEGMSPFHLVLATAQASLVPYFLHNSQISLDLPATTDGLSVFHLVVRAGEPQVMKQILASLSSALSSAAACDPACVYPAFVGRISALLHRPSSAPSCLTPLLQAVALARDQDSNRVQVLQLLLRFVFSIDSANASLLDNRSTQRELIRLLPFSSSSPSAAHASPPSPLSIPPTFLLPLSLSETDSGGNTALHIAVQEGYTTAVSLLLSTFMAAVYSFVGSPSSSSSTSSFSSPSPSGSSPSSPSCLSFRSFSVYLVHSQSLVVVASFFF